MSPKSPRRPSSRLPGLRRPARPFLYPGEEIHAAATPRVRLDGASKRAVETGRTRLMVTAGLFACAFALVGVRLVDLMALPDPGAGAAPALAASQPGPTGRGDIVDASGQVLATNLPVVDLFADARKVPDAASAARRVAAVLPDLKVARLEEKLASGSAFVYLKRALTPRQQEAVNDLGIPGLDFRRAERRVYPQGRLAAHLVGATDIDNQGIAGLEKALDARLADPAAEPLRLTIDLAVQEAVRHELTSAMARFRASGAAGLVMDVDSGALAALVSLPDFAPEDFGAASEDARFNRATLGVYEMGSVFKLFNTAIALESGTVSLGDGFDASHPLKVARTRFQIRDYHPQKRWLSVPEILIHSSNIGSAKMALKTGTETQRHFLHRLGMLAPVALALPETGAPLYPEPWREINTMTISYGHGIAVSPLHVARGVAAVVNGGLLPTPTLLAEPPRPAEPVRVFSEETSETMRRLMRLVVTKGSGRQADIAGYQVGGKTGTAEKVAAAGGYDRRSLRTTFVAAFPISQPRYVVLVTLDDPQGIKETWNFATAGWNAAPTAGRIIARVAPLLGVFPLAAADSARWDGETLKAALTREARLALR